MIPNNQQLSKICYYRICSIIHGTLYGYYDNDSLDWNFLVASFCKYLFPKKSGLDPSEFIHKYATYESQTFDAILINPQMTHLTNQMSYKVLRNRPYIHDWSGERFSISNYRFKFVTNSFVTSYKVNNC